jgi:hypothetical protein
MTAMVIMNTLFYLFALQRQEKLGVPGNAGCWFDAIVIIWKEKGQEQFLKFFGGAA